MELSKRLQAVADLVPEKSHVADIGCDHGYVSIYLIKYNHCEKVYAMDVAEGPLERAIANVKRFGLTDVIDVRLSDGTKALQPGEADTVLLAGMGARLMMRILTEGFERLGKFKTLVLQPQSEVSDLRVFLRKEGYIIEDEDFVFDDGKYYPMMRAVLGVTNKACSTNTKESLTTYSQNCEDQFGPILLQKRPEDFTRYLEREKEKLAEILKNVTRQERVIELEAYKKLLEEALQQVQ